MNKAIAMTIMIVATITVQDCAAKQKNSWWTKRSFFPAYHHQATEQNSSPMTQDSSFQDVLSHLHAAPQKSIGYQDIKEVPSVYDIFTPCFTYSSITQSSPCHCIFHRMLQVVLDRQSKAAAGITVNLKPRD